MQHNKRIILGLLCIFFLPMHGSWFKKKEPKPLTPEQIAENNKKLSAKNLAAYIQNQQWGMMMIRHRELLGAIKIAACDKKDPNLIEHNLPEDQIYKLDKKRTPLGLTAIMGDRTIGNLLIGCNADVNKVDGNGDTALKIAITHDRDDFARYLLGAQADPNQCAGGLTPLMWTVEPLDEHSFAARYLRPKKSKLFMQPLLDAKADPNAKDKNGNTVVVRAARKQNVGALQALLELGMSADQRSADGRTVREIAQANFDQTQVDLQQRYQRAVEQSPARVMLGVLAQQKPAVQAQEIKENK